MADELADEGRPAPYIAVQDGLVARTSAKQGGTPGDGANPVRMAVHHADPLHLVDVPEVDLSVVGSQAEGRPLRSPPDRSNRVGQSQIAKFGHFGVVSVPEIDIGGQADCQEVLLRPIDEVEVEIILQGWRIKHLERHFADFPFGFDGSDQVIGEIHALEAFLEGLVEGKGVLGCKLEDVIVLEVFNGVV
jgi:hypothetical protein